MHKKRKSGSRIGLMILFISIVSVLFIGFFVWCFWEVCKAPEEKTESVEKTKPTPLVIETQKPATTGSLTVYDIDGNVNYQYAGDIDIVNNGKNGEDIEIVIHLPDNGMCSCDPTYEMPMKFVLYDRTNMAIAQYSGYPEMRDGVLRLLDSDLLYIEHDSEWDDMVEREGIN